jgi:hypothetical protein
MGKGDKMEQNNDVGLISSPTNRELQVGESFITSFIKCAQRMSLIEIRSRPITKQIQQGEIYEDYR